MDAAAGGCRPSPHAHHKRTAGPRDARGGVAVVIGVGFAEFGVNFVDDVRKGLHLVALGGRDARAREHLQTASACDACGILVRVAFAGRLAARVDVDEAVQIGAEPPSSFSLTSASSTGLRSWQKSHSARSRSVVEGQGLVEGSGLVARGGERGL